MALGLLIVHHTQERGVRKNTQEDLRDSNMSQRKTRLKRWWQHSKKEKIGQNQKKKDEREETHEKKSQKTRIIYSDKNMKRGKIAGGYENETDSLKMTPKPQNRKKTSSEVSCNQTDSMTGRWKELNDVRESGRGMRAKRNRRWQKEWKRRTSDRKSKKIRKMVGR